MCSFALFVNYFADRFSIMRSWKRSPNLGPRMSKFRRKYFIPCAVLASAVMSSYYWAGFPFDNLCSQDSLVGSELSGVWLIDPWGHGTLQNVTITADDEAFDFCLQDYLRYRRDERSFPFLPRFQREEWMTEEQELVTNVWGWTSVAVIIAIALKIVLGWVASFTRMFRGTYEPCGKDQKNPFSKEESISAYIPQVESQVFSYPLIACSVDKLNPTLFDWKDHDRDHSYYDLTLDAEALLRGTDVSHQQVFSQITHWPPSETMKEEEELFEC